MLRISHIATTKPSVTVRTLCAMVAKMILKYINKKMLEKHLKKIKNL
jgi:F420-0:gamma-glutamyl ligase-like protein